ncbi:hypothetical protein J007_03466 [Cryptococcus neoformans]|nr:hypothetical protein J007_03466 [Cryptococcus neoformans var. grubii]OXC60986.1 hypothetical protein C358_03561 [Cryptococcus neoformans var. grubii MW-RSA852]
MYDLAYEEELRQQTVMAEVLPDAEMWRKWEKTEAPLRQGRGWYPRLDRHFLELLVISEIHCLSYPLDKNNAPSGHAERVHRHANRVRRVACERIGAERLHAYCERVKEAFEAYMMDGWARIQAHAQAQMRGQIRGQIEVNHFEDAEDEEIDENRGRKLERGNGSMIREVSPVQNSSTENSSALTDPFSDYEDEEDLSHLLEVDLKEVQLDELSEEEFEENFGDSASINATLGTNRSEIAGTRMNVDSERTYSSLASSEKRGPQIRIQAPEVIKELQASRNVRLAVQA